jgi:SAM-dependent methyltransferase
MREDIYPLTYKLEQDYWWYAGRREIILSSARKILSSIPCSGQPHILDYGCGTGINLLHLNELGEAYGVDASPQALAFCRERGLHRLALIDPNSTPGSANPFDQPFHLITLLDVLEHLETDCKALSGLGKLLDREGVILATVPAFELLWSGEDFVSNHLRRYTRRGLVKVFHEAGFEVLNATYFNTLLFPAQAAAILWNRAFNPRSMASTNLRPLPGRLNSVLTAILSYEKKLIKKWNLPVGGSILCCGRLRR